MDKIQIEVNQLPPVEYSLNFRGHWSKRYRAGRDYGLAIYYSAMDPRYRLASFTPFEKARIDLTFVFATNRKRDRDNLIARFKPGLDALVDANILTDDSSKCVKFGEINIEVDKSRAPMTIIKLTKEVKDV